MTRLTLNLENYTKEEKQKITDIVLCYAKSQIDRNINCITAEIEDEKVNHLISSLPSSVTITNQQKLEDNGITSQVMYHKPSGWLIVNIDHYNELHLKISELTTINDKLQKLAESYIPIDHVCIDKEEYNKLQQELKEMQESVIAQKQIVTVNREKYKKLKTLYQDLMGILAGTIDKFPYDI